MSVLINGMEMPTSCYDCDFAYQDQDSEHNVYWTCAAVHKAACMYERRDDCPLVPVPPHGRLIDADALMLAIQEYIEEYGDLDEKGWHSLKWCAMKEAEMAINNAPTIIPAEEVE